MLTVHHVNAFLLIGVCLLASAAAFRARRARAGGPVAHLLALARPLPVAPVAVGPVGLRLRIAFIIAIAVVAYLYWRDFGRREIGTWSQRAAVVFYAAVVLLVVDVGWWMLTGPKGRDLLVAILVAAGCGYAG